MRISFAFPLLLVAACSVENDPRNRQTTIGFDETIVTNTTDRLGNAAAETAAELEKAGRDISNEARDIDLDVNIRRGGEGNSTRNSN